jgi:hypothetical protein
MLAASLHAGTRETAFQARALLGPGIWSRVLHIENENVGPGSRYPAEFYGLMVAFEGSLWLYTELDGTQTLSLYAGRLAADQVNPGPLLRAVEPGLVRFADVTAHQPARLPAGALPRACFIAAVAHWSQLQRMPVPPTRARLLAYYSPATRQGHMVLEYWRAGRRYIFDPDTPAAELRLARGLPDDPLEVARTVARAGRQKLPDRAMHFELHAATSQEFARNETLDPASAG